MKKVLIITYYWPPAGGIGVLRCLKIAKYLRQFEWEPVIYTADNPSYPYLDQGNFKDIPVGIEVIKGRIWEPFSMFKALTGRKSNEPVNNVVHVRDKKQGLLDRLAIWVRGNYFIPDARSKWIEPSVRLLSEYIAAHRIDAIFSDGPPHTNTRIAGLLSQKFKIPWLADFQDPWTQVDYYKLFKISKRADALHRKMEQETFQWANKITIASPTWGKELEAIGAKDVDVIYYGYDEDDFKSRTQRLDDKLTIVHTGLLGFDRCPDPFITALGELVAENPDVLKLIKIKLIGQVDYNVNLQFEAAGLQSIVELVGTVSREEALQATYDAQLLLLPLNKADNINGRLPGKLYEYLRCKRPIMVLGPQQADASKIVESCLAGVSFGYEDTAGMKNYLKQQIVQFKGDGIPNHNGDVTDYSNENQTRRVAELLNQITS